ncbi:MAG: winged helix DNA-binding protein [Anaerolineae bacterium]|nr:winged helix DNA-binding protein [Anaerolineae bacterium]
MLMLTKINGRYREQRLASFGADISNMQFGMLRVLSLGEQTLSELSRHMVLDPSTLVPAVAKLRRRGLIQARRDRRDRRRAPLSLTDRGRALIEEIANFEDDDPIFAAVNVLGPEKSQQLVGMLRELMESTPEGRELLAEMHLRMVAHGACLPQDARHLRDGEKSEEKSSP